MAEQVLEVIDTVHTFKDIKQVGKSEVDALLEALVRIPVEEEIS